MCLSERIDRLTRRLCYEWDNIKPDMVILGKALSGGGESLFIRFSLPLSAYLPGGNAG